MTVNPFLLLFASLWLSTAVISAQTGSVAVTVTDIEAAGKGSMVFMLFAGDEGFPKEALAAAYRHKVTTFGTTATYTFADLPAGEYALAVFQDLDGDGEIATNFIGIPREPIVASKYGADGQACLPEIRFSGGRFRAGDHAEAP